MFYLLVNVVMAVLATAWVCFLPLDWIREIWKLESLPGKTLIICTGLSL